MRLIILRHADRAEEHLTAKGRARAEALPDALRDQEIDAILSPGIQRNLDTAAPLAKATGVPITRIPMEGAAQGIAAQGPDTTVVWVGNKGNLADIWDAFGIPGDPPLNYGELFIVTRQNGRFDVERRFHGPSL